MKNQFTRWLFLKRAGQAFGIIVFLPAAKAIGKITRSAAHHANEEYYEHNIITMGTTARVGVYARSEEEANHVITSTFEELNRLESLLSVFDVSSEISKLNDHPGGDLQFCSRDTFEILKAAKHYSILTDGAFEATIEPIMRLWGFRNESNVLTQLPTNFKIENLLQFVGNEQLEINELQSSARLRSGGAKIDTCGIAVGYALDKMIAIIKSSGIENAFIDISGDMFALGSPLFPKNPILFKEGVGGGSPNGWQAAIPDPRDTSRLIYNTTISNEALATSGNYESFVVYQARKFGHIMDPKVGRSARSILSSTVIAKTGLDADALSTASFVTGLRYGETRLVAVGRDGEVKSS